MARMGPRSAVLAACLIALAACGGSSGTATDPGVTSSTISLGVTIAKCRPRCRVRDDRRRLERLLPIHQQLGRR